MDIGKITHCISVKEPYVSLIVAGAKTLEWRSRKLIARPPETIAIATSKAGAGDYLPGGYIVGIARISSVVPFLNREDFYERMGEPELYREYLNNRFNAGSRGFHGLDGYAMMISSFSACEPVPVRGNVGIYRAPAGFEPVYAETPEQLCGWWSGARMWRDGPRGEVERELMDAMLAHGCAWRIDD